MGERHLAIDLYCGLGGWTEGLLAEGWRVIGFDIERHVYGEHRYPAQLVIQDVLTLHGSQFKDAGLIVASPPCQEFSYMAMPWSLAKKKQHEYETGVRDVKDLTRLFDACFRIQREACKAAGRHIPMVVENVRGAQRWVGRARWNFGSFYLWGDVPALMPITKTLPKVGGISWSDFGKPDYKPQAFNGTAAKIIRDGHRLPDFRFDGNGKSFQTASVEGTKDDGSGWRENGCLASCNRMVPDGTKAGKDWFGGYGGSFGSDSSPMRRNNSKSNARKAASAIIAKIPLTLSRYIGAVYMPFQSPMIGNER